MKGKDKGWPQWAIWALLVICLAIVFDALFLRSLDLNFHYDIQLTEIIGVVVTIILALYLAQVVEEHREKKKAKTEILSSILGGLFSDVDSLSNQIYESRLPYARLSTFTKMASKKVQSIVDVINALEIENTEINDSVSSIQKRLQYMRPVLSEIKAKKEEKKKSEGDYMVVDEGVVKEIGDKRISRIQSNLSDLRKQLCSVWLAIVALD